MPNATTSTVIERLRSASGQLRDLIEHAERIQSLDRASARVAGDPLATFCQVANFSSSTVTFHTHSPAWGAKLRYRIPEVLACLRNEYGDERLVNAQIKIRPQNHPRIRNAARPRALSRASISLLEQVANTTRDARLKEALLRLARHAGTVG